MKPLLGLVLAFLIEPGQVIPVTPVTPIRPVEPAAGLGVSRPSENDLATMRDYGEKPFRNVIPAVRKRFDDLLTDYPTARFRDVRLGMRDGERVVCGLVNGRNSYGAYVGWQPFYALVTGSGLDMRILATAEASTNYKYRYWCGLATAFAETNASGQLAYDGK